MKAYQLILLGLVLGPSLSDAAKNVKDTTPVQSQSTVRSSLNQMGCGGNESLSSLLTSFGWDLFKAVESSNKNKNLIFNPTSVQYLLSVMLAGATGKTQSDLCSVVKTDNFRAYDEIFKGYSVDPEKKGKNEYVTANGVFVAQGTRLNQGFLNYLDNSDYLTFQSVDFVGPQKKKSIANINSWASQSTRGTINEILDPNNDYSYTKLLLASAVYFRGTWRTAFKPSFYEDGFQVSEKQRIQVPFMHQRRNFYSGPILEPNSEERIGYFVELPYENNQFAMIIVLPEEDQTLQNVINKLNIQPIMKGTSPLFGEHDVNVTLPKFEISWTQSLVQPLKDLGLDSTFSPQATFPYIFQGESAAVADVVQNSYINVDEKGTRAASVTTVNVIALSASEPEETIQFTVDRPFVAIITLQGNDQRIPLFISKVVKPNYPASQ